VLNRFKGGTVSDDQAETIAFLSKPEGYSLAPGEDVERHETHGSFVFLAGDRACKLKRAVKFLYMDYSTIERRKAMCERELAVNRRLAPELYLETVPVRRGRDGTLHIGPGDGQILDWLVVMRRFGQDDLLESRRKAGKLDARLMRDVGERLAAFHQDAERQTEFGGAAGIATVVDENKALLGPPLDAGKIARLNAAAGTMLKDLAPFLEIRREAGFVRRVHGDLHLNNICIFEGKAVPFDAIEFQDDFASIDVLFDLALLLMDLDRHGLRHEANVVLNRYLERTGDYEGLKALPLFLSCRAAMRAHVTLAMKRSDARETAHLLDCALTYLEPQPATLLAIGGVSGTGKSTLAAALAPQIGRSPGAIVIRADVVRKALWGTEELTRLPAEAYDERFTDRVYDAMMERAGAALAGGHSAIVDAVMGHARQRTEVERLAEERNAAFHGLWLDAPADVLEKRVAARRNDASDATIEVLRAQLANIRPPDRWSVVDVSGDPDDVVKRAVASLQTRGVHM
jgi:aminoglycoside phosphotransferase family enzyme/predicted kinase